MMSVALVVSDAGTGLSVDVRVRMLVVHQAEGFCEHGVAVSLSYNPTPSTPLGFAARLAPSSGRLCTHTNNGRGNTGILPPRNALAATSRPWTHRNPGRIAGKHTNGGRIDRTRVQRGTEPGNPDDSENQARMEHSMKSVASKTYMAHVSAGADAEAALAAAEELGEIGSDVRILKWMVGVVIGLLLAGFSVVAGALFQISLRLP